MTDTIKAPWQQGQRPAPAKGENDAAGGRGKQRPPDQPKPKKRK